MKQWVAASGLLPIIQFTNKEGEMLIILRRFHKKPKYKPVVKANIWVVNDSKTCKTYFGPKDLNSCQKFIREYQKEEA